MAVKVQVEGVLRSVTNHQVASGVDHATANTAAEVLVELGIQVTVATADTRVSTQLESTFQFKTFVG